MLDSAIAAVLHTTLTAGLAARGVSAGVKRNDQSRQFVAPSTPTVFYTYGSRKLFGWTGYKDVLNDPPGTGFTTIKTQIVHTRFQIAGFAPNISPAEPYALTSGDLATIANSIMTDEANLATFVAAGFNVFRVQELPVIWFQDSNAQNVAWASFDIIFTHKDTYTTVTGGVTEFDQNINSI